jgi:hypothetical protein
MDNRTKTPDDIEVHLGLPSLSEKSLNGVYPLVSNGVPPNSRGGVPRHPHERDLLLCGGGIPIDPRHEHGAG